MAQAAALVKTLKYRLKPDAGDLAGEIVTIIDNETFPDSDPRRRKVTVDHDGEIIYLLPRVIEDFPLIGMQHGGDVPVEATQAAVEMAFAPAVEAAVFHTTQPPVSAVPAFAPITDWMDDRLDHLRPNRGKILRKYKSRVMENGQTDIEFFLKFTEAEWREQNEDRPMNVSIKGDTQSGKTFLVEALAHYWAEMLGLPKAIPIFTLSGSAGVTDYDLFGQMTVFEGVPVWLPGVVDMAARIGGILYLDEANFMGERVTSSLHSLIDHRHHFLNRAKAVKKGGVIMPETVKASFDLWVIATINEGYKGTGPFNEAFAGRFENVLWGYHEDVEKMLVPSPTLRTFGESLRIARVNKAINTPVGTSHLERFAVGIKTFGLDQALSNFLGNFQPNERGKVKDIFMDRDYYDNMKREIAQAARNAADVQDDANQF